MPHLRKVELQLPDAWHGPAQWMFVLRPHSHLRGTPCSGLAFHARHLHERVPLPPRCETWFRT